MHIQASDAKPNVLVCLSPCVARMSVFTQATIALHYSQQATAKWTQQEPLNGPDEWQHCTPVVPQGTSSGTRLWEGVHKGAPALITSSAHTQGG